MSFEQIDFTAFWAWFLIFTRMAGMFSALPGVGTEQVPAIVRMSASLIISMTIAATGVHAESPGTGAEGLPSFAGEAFAR